MILFRQHQPRPSIRIIGSKNGTVAASRSDGRAAAGIGDIPIATLASPGNVDDAMVVDTVTPSYSHHGSRIMNVNDPYCHFSESLS